VLDSDHVPLPDEAMFEDSRGLIGTGSQPSQGGPPVHGEVDVAPLDAELTNDGDQASRPTVALETRGANSGGWRKAVPDVGDEARALSPKPASSDRIAGSSGSAITPPVDGVVLDLDTSGSPATIDRT
jgi:hypothetical protein